MVKLLVKTKYAHLANILLGEPAVPEFLQGQCNSTELAKGLFKLVEDDMERKIQLSKTSKIRDMLKGEGGDMTPSDKAADFVLAVGKEPARVFGKKAPIKKRPAPVKKKKPEKVAKKA